MTRIKTNELTLTLAALALGAACASTQPATKGPENEPVREEGGGAAARPGPAKPLGHDELEAEASRPEADKAKLDVGKDAEEAFDKALEQAAQVGCKQAADAFGRVADKYPKIVSARYNQGLEYEKCGMTTEARQAFEQAIRTNPRYANAIAGLGVVALRTGHPTDAESYFKQALGIDQRCLPASVNMAALLRDRAMRTGDQNAAKEAQDDVRRALAVDGNNMAAYTTLALIYYDLAGNDLPKLEMASTVIEQAKKINDKHAPLWNVSGLVWLKKKNVTMALKEFRQAVQLDPGLIEAQLNIGAITLSFRDYALAEQSFRAVLGKDPKNTDALLGLGVALRGQRKIKEAEEQYQAVAKMDPSNCGVPYNLGLLYQDYMTGQETELRRAQGYYREFVSRCGGKYHAQAQDADRRSKNIDETFLALQQAKQLEQEAGRIQKMQEEQQKRQEEQQKNEKKDEKKDDGKKDDAKKEE